MSKMITGLEDTFLTAYLMNELIEINIGSDLPRCAGRFSDTEELIIGVPDYIRIMKRMDKLLVPVLSYAQVQQAIIDSHGVMIVVKPTDDTGPFNKSSYTYSLDRVSSPTGEKTSQPGIHSFMTIPEAWQHAISNLVANHQSGSMRPIYYQVGVKIDIKEK